LSVKFQIEIFVLGWSLAQRSPSEFVVSECDREASKVRMTWPTRGCFALE